MQTYILLQSHIIYYLCYTLCYLYYITSVFEFSFFFVVYNLSFPLLLRIKHFEIFSKITFLFEITIQDIQV